MTIELAADSAALRKARGAFFTPPQVTRFLARWGIRSASDRVLEPSCGDGAILTAAVEQLQRLEGHAPLRAHELHPDTASQARRMLADAGYPGEVVVGDFLASSAAPSFDVVLGNPPYVRYQGFTGEARAIAMSAALAQGVRLSRLSSSWAPFAIHAAGSLKDSGRMALVLPAELLAANYAQEVRDYLLRRFASVSVVMIEGLVFPGVQTETLLLLVEGTGGTNHINLAVVRDAAALDDVHFHAAVDVGFGERWTSALVSAGVTNHLGELQQTDRLAPLSTWGRLSLGAVTGNNRFFTLSPTEALVYGLEKTDLVPISPAGSSHLRTLSFTKADHLDMGRGGAKTLLFRPDKPSAAARVRIAQGESQGVDQAYKCRVRTPWWRTPLPAPPDLFFTYMNQTTPQLSTNPARLYYLNSVHGVYLHAGLVDLTDLLPLAALNTVTSLSAEITGRAYGGGILKMEPREAAKLLVPSAGLVRRHEADLRMITPRVRSLLQSGDLSRARGMVDDVLLVGEDADRLRTIHESLDTLGRRRRGRATSRPTPGGSG